MLTTLRRTAGAVVLAAAVVSPLTACSLTGNPAPTPGTPAAAPSASPTVQASPRLTSPTVEPTVNGGSAVIDPDSGVAVQLPGPAQRQVVIQEVAGRPVTVVTYVATDAARTISVTFTIVRVPAGQDAGLDQVGPGAARVLNGRVVRTDPTVVAGHDGRDVRIEGALQGQPVVSLVRAVATETHLVAVQTIGRGAVRPAVEQTHAQAVGSLQLPVS